MRIHREGYNSIGVVLLIVIFLLCLYFIGFNSSCLCLGIIVTLLLLTLLFFTIRFFRVPSRVVNRTADGVLSPADGTVVQINEVFEDEYFKDQRIQISIFMSPLNVHVNSYPIDGTVSYVKYHPGKHYIAKLPKASKDNEHNSVVVRNEQGVEILFRQIAGIVARRIVSYSQENDQVKQGEEMGIIKFGSRVDLFLPLNAKINVKIADKVRSQKSVMAYLPTQ